MEPVPYPENYPELPKLNVLKRQAEAMGRGSSFYRVPQTTRFENGPNSTGVEMQASALTGMDCTGVNDGSKSSTLVNYLSDAWNWGAEMYATSRFFHLGPKQLTISGSASAKSDMSRRTPKVKATSYTLPGMEQKGPLSAPTSSKI